jgi:hypothetical protein
VLSPQTVLGTARGMGLCPSKVGRSRFRAEFMSECMGCGLVLITSECFLATGTATTRGP